jgi:hypothetical protein
LPWRSCAGNGGNPHLADAELLPQPRGQQRTADPLGIERQAAVILIERL